MRFLLAAFFMVLLSGCGAETGMRSAPVDPSHPPVPPKKLDPEIQVVLEVFGAPWCGPCKATLPQVEDELKKLDSVTRKKIEFRLFVITGAKSNEPPTQVIADKYRDFLKLSASAHADVGQKEFRAVVGNSGIPAGGVLDTGAKVLRKFTGGFAPKEIVSFAVSQTK